jgi:hypothetical protein
MKRRRVSADSTVSNLSRNSGVPDALAPGTIRSDTTTTVANWCASKVAGLKGAAARVAGFFACSATCAECLWTGCSSALATPGTASDAPKLAASVCSAVRRESPVSGAGWMTGNVRPAFMRDISSRRGV